MYPACERSILQERKGAAMVLAVPHYGKYAEAVLSLLKNLER